MRPYLFLLALLSAAFSIAAVSDVNVISLTGPVATARITPPNGSAVAYLMNYPGQKAICFQSASSTEVYMGSSTVTNTNGWGLFSKGDSFCADISGGTTVYFYGNGSNANVRAIFVR
jgi:uncharacterized protein YfaP (DUF2135 family)